MPPQAHSEHAAVHLERVERLARLMDEAVRVPGTRFRIGFDGILGLFPVVGDAISLGTNAYVIYVAEQLGVPRRTIARMVLNSFVDFAGGSVPLVGDVFDFAFKSHRRNMALLRAALARHESPLPERKSWLGPRSRRATGPSSHTI